MADLDEDELKATRRLNGVDILDEGKGDGVDMSEEEIIKECNKLLVTLSLHHIDGRIIQGLLDLYNHEKSTSHYLQSELDKANAKIVELNKKIQDKITEIKNKPVKDMFITASQAKLDTIIAIESILEEKENV